MAKSAKQKSCIGPNCRSSGCLIATNLISAEIRRRKQAKILREIQLALKTAGAKKSRALNKAKKEATQSLHETHKQAKHMSRKFKEFIKRSKYKFPRSRGA